MKLWIARILVVLLVIVVVLVIVYWEEINTFIDTQSGDSGGEIVDDDVYTDSEFEYSVRLGSDWQVFERLYNEGNTDLVPEQIIELLQTCGISCASVGTIKMGDFPGTDCETDECFGLQSESYEGAALTVYVLSNPGELQLDEFMATALGKSVWAEHFSDVTLPDGRVAKRETITAEDGSTRTNLYLAEGTHVYWLDQDIIAKSFDDLGDISRALEDAMNSFEIR